MEPSLLSAANVYHVEAIVVYPASVGTLLDGGHGEGGGGDGEGGPGEGRDGLGGAGGGDGGGESPESRVW